MTSGKWQCRVFNLISWQRTQVHTQIHWKHCQFWCFWACTIFEADGMGSKHNRFSYDYTISSYISIPGIIFHTRICQCAHKLLWSIDRKPEMGLIRPVLRHCWYDDYVGTWQRILWDICTAATKENHMLYIFFHHDCHTLPQIFSP